jgi:hypothetical protein
MVRHVAYMRGKRTAYRILLETPERKRHWECKKDSEFLTVVNIKTAVSWDAILCM